MGFENAYVTDKFAAHTGFIRSPRLSMAIWLKDGFTGKEPVGNIRVKIKEGEIKPVKNPSGYYVFTGLASGKYTINIESDAYFPEEPQIDTSRINAEDIILGFDGTGPAKGAVSADLGQNAAKLQENDIVEFRNPRGDMEQKRITKITGGKKIFWVGELKYDFTAKGSTIHVLKYLIDEIILRPRPSYSFPGNTTMVRGLIFDLDDHPVGNAKVTVKDGMGTITDTSGEFVLYFSEIKDAIEIQINGTPVPDKVTLEKGKTIIMGKIILP